MYRLVRLGECVHVFDNQNNRFEKSSANNIANALGSYSKDLTRKEMVRGAQWILCVDPNCRFKCCEEGGHWFALNASR